MKKRKDGRYQKPIMLSNGKRKMVYGRTLAEIQDKARQVIQQDEAGILVDDHTLVGDWARTWLTSYKSGLRYATVQMYRSTYNNHIMELLGSMELQDVRPVHVRAVMASVADQSESLQHKVLITMRQMFATARQNGLVSRDPTEGVRTTPHAAAKGKQYLLPDEVTRLLQSVSEPRARAFVGLCLFCGLRKEEALGLQWGDIGAGQLAVARAMTFGSNQQLESQELKTKAACRMLPVPDALQTILDQVPRLSAYVVPAAGGAPMSRSAFTSLWRRHVLACVDFEVRPHMLRHTYATMLYRAGVPLRTAQYLLGHSSITMTAQIYTHLEAADSLQVVGQVNSYLEDIGVV